MKLHKTHILAYIMLTDCALDSPTLDWGPGSWHRAVQNIY